MKIITNLFFFFNSDTICDLGGVNELANYGEYSGAPSEQQTYDYAKTILSLMTREKHPEGKKVAGTGKIVINYSGRVYSSRLLSGEAASGGKNEQSWMVTVLRCAWERFFNVLLPSGSNSDGFLSALASERVCIIPCSKKHKRGLRFLSENFLLDAKLLSPRPC